MALKKITENPKITDTILFELETPDGDDCFVNDPYKIDTVVIYHVERDFLGTNFGDYEMVTQDQDLLALVESAKAAVCNNPSAENLQTLNQAVSKLESSQLSSTYYYKDRTPVDVIGNADFPAWLSTDTTNSTLVKVEEDEDGNPLYGNFTLEWNPNGSVREGDYFICWTWTPLVAGEKLSAHTPFFISGDPKAVTTIPTHMTPDEKYDILLERYLPEMYKSVLCQGDLTPETTLKLNKAVAGGFTVIENFANQIIDLFDSNALHESLLMYLSNLFNLKLKSSDPTLWRRQIKEAIPLFKKKGTYDGIKEAFSQAGMKLNKYTQFWQLVSPYTWQESFKVNGTTIWELEKDNIVLPVTSNFELSWRQNGTDVYVSLTSDYVDFEINDQDCTVRMIWVGDGLSSNPITLNDGDFVRILYEYKEVPDLSAQQLENYIQSLPLADLRDETEQDYPLKNWNVRLIDEEDPLFDILIPTRHPFHDPLIFGYIRTEFPYGENIYNMEEYNGSTRPSFDACNIDKDFIDPCGACLGSKYSVDIGIEELSNDRMIESQDILEEYMPFHAQLHTINFTGDVVEFVTSPIEDIDFLVTINQTENHLSGESNPFFNRAMEGGLSNWIIDREDLADKTTVLSGKLGRAYNSNVIIITPDVDLNSLGVNPLGKHILEVLCPCVNAGKYKITNTENRTAKIDSDVVEPLDESQFTFRLSNIVYSKSNYVSITQDDKFTFGDSDVDYITLGVKGNWDVENVPNYTGGAWEVLIPSVSATAFKIENIIDGNLILVDNGSLPLTGSLSYSLLDDVGNTIVTSTGDLSTERRGFVNLNDPYLIEREQIISIGDFLFYDNGVNQIEYEIIEFTDQDKFFITGWTDGAAVGVSVDVHRRLVENAVGQFAYQGLELVTFADHEVEFGIMNGSNPPNLNETVSVSIGDPNCDGTHDYHENNTQSYLLDNNSFKENYMFLINNQFFKILEWNGKNVKLAGREQSWKTNNTNGTGVAYSIVHFPKKQMNVQFVVFDELDRDGKDPVIRTIEDLTDMNQAIVALSSGPSSGVEEQVGQDESISFIIETTNGQTEEGDI